jgi:hypothetical protein
MSAFANGTEFYEWRAAWCETCTKDRQFVLTGEVGADGGCQIATNLVTGDPTPEIRRGPGWSMQTINYCTAYEQWVEPTTPAVNPPALASALEDPRQLTLMPLKEELI